MSKLRFLEPKRKLNVRRKGRNERKQSHNEGKGGALEWQSRKGRKTLCCVSNSIPFVLREAWEADRQLPSSDKWSVINVCFSFLYKCEVVSKISPVQLLKSPSSQTLSTGNSHGHPDVSLHSVCLCSVYIYLFLLELWLHEMLYYGDWSFARKYWEGELRDAWVQGDTWPLSQWSISENYFWEPHFLQMLRVKKFTKYTTQLRLPLFCMQRTRKKLQWTHPQEVKKENNLSANHGIYPGCA